MIKNTMIAVLVALLLPGCDDHAHHDDAAPKSQHNDHQTHEADEAADAAYQHKTEGTVRQADSHVHGDATLALALDGNRLTIELDTPIYNLTGFEHEPQSTADRRNLENTETLLSNPTQLFDFSHAANCSLLKDNITVSLGFHEEGEDEHGDEHEDEHDEEHRDAIIEYHYTCAMPEKLALMTTYLFSKFPNLTELEAIYLGPGIQTQTELTPEKIHFNLTH